MTYYIQSLMDNNPQLIRAKLYYLDKYKYNINLHPMGTLWWSFIESFSHPSPSHSYPKSFAQAYLTAGDLSVSRADSAH